MSIRIGSGLLRHRAGSNGIAVIRTATSELMSSMVVMILAMSRANPS